MISPPLLIQTNLRNWKQASLLPAELSRDHARVTYTLQVAVVHIELNRVAFLFLASW